jgi:hypothetical protein
MLCPTHLLSLDQRGPNSSVDTKSFDAFATAASVARSHPFSRFVPYHHHATRVVLTAAVAVAALVPAVARTRAALLGRRLAPERAVLLLLWIRLQMDQDIVGSVAGPHRG